MSFLTASLRYGSRPFLLANQQSFLYRNPINRIQARTSMESPEPGDTPILSEDFFKKQMRLKRPLSPFISIYKPQITWTMSIGYRITEVFILGSISTYGIYLFAMDYTNFGYLFTALSDLQIPSSVLTAVKLIAGIPFGYFVWGGLRHIAWDRGIGFSLPTLYKSAYLTITLSLLTGLALAFCKF
ncbi:Succinate dehydrogenase cytochrome b560 subunit, mitochondrial [Oopsacas minuta]|uniref:Succinate dehydrogenase cytochrome b560 subunit, mitochondrial n=1 Tax=Oopsacas minuta TaxID=111878 RepID=A0AAV7JSQ2_9METZ|nr:Succinate dehydrogenase cytochrome b560 subunit, mitochondrial [Oopsacas minuta]